MSKQYSISQSLRPSFKRLTWEEPISDKFYKIALGLAGTAVEESYEILTGASITKLSIEELKQQLLVKLKKIKLLAGDPLIQKYVNEASTAIANLTLRNLIEIQEPLLQIAERILELIKTVSNKTVAASLEAALGIIMSAIAEVPLLGGVIDLLLTISRTFNRGSSLLKMSVSNLTDIGKLINEIVTPTLSDANTVTRKIKETHSNINKRLKDLQLQNTPSYKLR